METQHQICPTQSMARGLGSPHGSSGQDACTRQHQPSHRSSCWPPAFLSFLPAAGGVCAAAVTAPFSQGPMLIPCCLYNTRERKKLMPTWSFHSMWLQAPWGLFPSRQLGEAPVARSEWQLQISTRQPAKKLRSKDKHPELQNTWITHHRFVPFPFSALGQLSSTPFVQEEFFVVTEHSEHEVKQAEVPWPSSYRNTLNIETHAVFLQ